MLLFSVWGQFTKLSAPLTLLIRTLLTNCTTYLQQLYIPLPLFIGENVDRTCLAHWTRLTILADYVNTLEAEMMTAADGQMRVSLNLAEAYGTGKLFGHTFNVGLVIEQKVTASKICRHFAVTGHSLPKLSA